MMRRPTIRTRAAETAGGNSASDGMSTRDAGSGLSNLIEGKPQSKLGRIRWHWPDIKAALRDGHQLKQVWECLVLDGIDLSYSKFRTYIVRLRRLEAAGADLPGSASPTRETGPPLQQVTLKRDPLANLRDRVNKRPGFEFDERPPDRKKLI